MSADTERSAMGTRKLAQALAERVSEADWAEIVTALVQSAKEGNASAARLLVQARFGAKRWLSPTTDERDSVSRRKLRLLKILNPDEEKKTDDNLGTAGLDCSVRAS